MCLYPRLMYNGKYRANQKNGGVIPRIQDPRVTKVAIGCGECIECRKKKAREWQVRMLEDIKVNKNGKFITLTFSPKWLSWLREKAKKNYLIKQSKRAKYESKTDYIRRLIEEKKEVQLHDYHLDHLAVTLAVRLYTERWRKKYGKTLRHWLITELGHNGTERIHMHGIVWTDKTEDIENIWKYGHVWKGNEKNGRIENYVSARTVNYIIKYVSKKDIKHEDYKSMILCSKGIGKTYTETPNSKTNAYNGDKTREYYRTDTLHKIALPIYYRNKIYTDEEREKLWIQLMDKNIRYVGGQKIDISKGLKEYKLKLEHTREMSKELGYRQPKGMQWKIEEYMKQLEQ